MHVRVRVLGKPEIIVVVESKLTKIELIRKQIFKKLSIEPKLQRLFYGGKLLENGYSIHDYGIKLNDVIQVMVQSELAESSKKLEDSNERILEKSSEAKVIYEDVKCNKYRVGDLVDMKHKEWGSWFEGEIVRIVKDPGKKQLDSTNVENEPPANLSKTQTIKTGIAGYFSKGVNDDAKKCQDTSVTEDGVLFFVKLDTEDDEDDTEYLCKLNEIRPRARNIISVNNLKVGQKVMLNHNPDDINEKGYWYDFKISEIIKHRRHEELVGTLYIGAESIPQNDVKVKVVDHIYAIEEVVPLADRSEEYQKMMITPTNKRSAPLNCLTCRDVEDKPCRDCGCYKCAGKESPDEIILCDECNNGYHMRCLTPPLSELPSDDWYCPNCKRENTVVAPGAAKQAKKSDSSKGKRDWGRGMACMGKTKTSTMPSNHFGPIPGIEVGMTWRFRIQISETGVHRPPVSGIHGRDVEGAYSIVLSGGYEDDYDNGEEFTYTGSGGRDLSGNKRTAEQSCDQTLTRENRALARNCAVKTISEEGGDAGENWRAGKPVRVVRSYKMMKHFPQYAPQEGIRYDGIYKVVKYYPEKGKSGFRVWKYLLRRDDPNPAPWEPGSKEYPIVYPDGYLEAEAEKKALKAKGKAPKGGNKKRKLVPEPASCSGDEASSDERPPNKRKKELNTPDAVKQQGRKSQRLSVTASPKEKIPEMFSALKTKSQKKNAANVLENNLNRILNDDEIKAIKADTLNVKLWDECMQVSDTSTKKDFVEHVTTLFLCIICQDVPANPVTTSCLHNFCMGCLKLSFKSTGMKSCPCCRRDLSKEEAASNEALRGALRAVMPGYDIGKK